MVRPLKGGVLSILIGLFLLTRVSPAPAADIRWSDAAADDRFHTAGNWTGGLVPGLLDIAQFGRSFPVFQHTYTVSFINNATNQALHIEDDRVTFDLNSRQYTVTSASGIVIGNEVASHAGQLTILDGTLSSSTNIDVGAAVSKVGTLVVGQGGLLSGAPTINIGKLGTGTLRVQAGGEVTSTGATNIGVGTGATGTATVFGNGTIGSATLLTGALNVGNTGNGTVNVQLGGLLQNSGTASIASGSFFTSVGTGNVNVMNLGSVWNSQGLLKVGDGGNGEVNVTLGGKVTSVDSIVGADVSNAGEVNVDGASSLWDNSGSLTVGGLGAGTLNITNQGVVETTDAVIGSANFSTSNGTVNVSGAGSLWTITDDLNVGSQGTGTLNIRGGGTVRNQLSFLNHVGLDNGTGLVTVNGAESIWETNRVFIGSGGSGTVIITNGGTVRMLDAGLVGNGPGFSGTVAVSGANSLWETTENLVIGVSGEGVLTISGGGKVKSVESVIGRAAGGEGDVTVNGVGSVWEYSGKKTPGENDVDFIVGDSGDGMLEIMGGGQVIAAATSGTVVNLIGSQAGSTGVVRVTGEGSAWDAGGVAIGEITVGNAGTGTLEIISGGAMEADEFIIGELSSGNGMVTVSGSDSLLVSSGFFEVGRFGRGTLAITGGGEVITGSDALVGSDSGVETFGSATVVGAGSTWEVGGRLKIGVNRSEEISGRGTVRIQSGATVATGSHTEVNFHSLLSLEGGTLSTSEIIFLKLASADLNFEWTSGTLHVGVFGGDLINQAGVLAPGNSIGATIVQGNYNQLAGATLQIEIGGSTNRDVVEIEGNAFLDGALQVALMNGSVPNLAESFTVLDAGLNIFDSFSNVANGQRLTTSDGLGSFIVNYGAGSAFDPDQIVLSNFLAGAIPGDFDDDGDVDGDDLAQWEGDFGVNDLSNADGDNDSDGNDFLTWQRQVGSAPATVTTAAVPEPGSLLLMWQLTAVATAGRRLLRRFTRCETML